MRTLLDQLEVVAVARRLPTPGETATVVLGESGPRGRGDRLDLPAFASDPRLDPDLPVHLRKRIDRFAAVGYLAVAQLISSIPVAQRAERERIGTFLANTRAGWSYGEPELGLLVAKGAEAMHAYQATAWFPAAAQGEVTIELDLRGCAKTTAGRASGFGEALWLARDALERDAIDLAVVGAVESLVNGFVLRDWAEEDPLPDTGTAEGAVVFALRRPSGRDRVLLTDLRHSSTPVPRDESWVPTLSAATRLLTALHTNEIAAISLGGGFWITVDPPKYGAPMTTVLSEITPVGELAVEARHELDIPGPIADVFEMTRDVTRWHEYMPAVTGAEFIEQAAGSDLVEITAEANDQKHTWRSRRTIDSTGWTIEFARFGVTEPLVRMEGRWQFVAAGEHTHAVLSHHYEVTTPEALVFFTDATRSNATRDLQGLADHFSQKESDR